MKLSKNKNILQKQTPQTKEAQMTTTLKRKDSSQKNPCKTDVALGNRHCILTKLLRFDEVIRVISTKRLIPNSSTVYPLLKTIFFSSVVTVQKLCSQVAQAT